MSVYQQAKQFVARGIAVFPVQFRGKKPAVPSWEVYKTTLPTDSDLRRWFPCDLRNYAICLGWQRLAVLDFDDIEAYQEWDLWAIQNCPIMDTAYAVKTARGKHLYFTLLEDVNNMKLPGIDFKIHGYCIGPGSTHPSGWVYSSSTPLNFPIVERLADILPAETLAQARAACENIKPVSPIPAVNISLSLLDEIGQADLYQDKTPLEKIALRWRIEGFFPGEKVDHAGYLHVKCPFHADDNPSAWVDTRRQLFGCHSCNMKPMTVVGFYAALHQIDIKQAIAEMLV